MLSLKTFNNNMELLCETYQRAGTKLFLKAYYMACKNMSDVDFERSIELILSKRIYNTMPMPAEILQAIAANWEDG